jgi:hypothetical protein
MFHGDAVVTAGELARRMMSFDGRAAGRGGTAIAVFDGPSLMLTNPGRIGFLDGSNLDANITMMIPALKGTLAQLP